MPGRHWFRSEVDAGWAWVVSAASFALQFIVIGTGQSFGIIYGSLMQEFKAGEAATAWVGALAYGFVFLHSPVTTALCEHFGCRVVSCTGSIMCMTGLLLSSYVTSISTLYLTFSLLWGIGASLTFFPSMLTLRFFFDRKMSQANGLAMSGAGVGTLVCNIVLRDINERHGWRGCLRVLCGLNAGLFLCGSMFRPPPADFCGTSQWSEWSKNVGLLTKLQRMFDSRPWKVKGFAVWVLAHSTILFAYFTPYIHLIQFAKTLGISTSDGAVLVGYLSITATVGKLLCGRLADFPKMKRLYLLATSALALAVSTMGVTAAKNYDGLLTFVLIFGFFDGCFVVVVPQITQDIVGRPLTANALGAQYGISAITMTLGPPVTGEIYKVSGSYNVAFFVGAALILAGTCMLYFVQRLRPDLVCSKPWPGPTTAQQQSASLIPGHSIESLISGLDTLSGMCIPSPSPNRNPLGQMEMTDYQRFDHHATESTTSHLEFDAPQAHVERKSQERDVTVVVTTSDILEHASLETEPDRQSSSGPGNSLHTIDQLSCSDVPRDSAVSEGLVVLSSDTNSVQSASFLWRTGIITTSKTDFETELNQPGNYEVSSNASNDASIAGIAVEIESRNGDWQSRDVSREDILLGVSSSDAMSYATKSATTVDMQSLLSWENAGNEISGCSSEVEVIRLPPLPPNTKQDITSPSILLGTTINEKAVRHDATNLEIFSSPYTGNQSSTLVELHSNTTQAVEEKDNLIMTVSDVTNLVKGTGNDQEESQSIENRSTRTRQPSPIPENLVDISTTGVDQRHPQSSADDSTDTEMKSKSSTEENLPVSGTVNEQSCDEMELVRLPPPPQIPRTGTLVVVHDEPPVSYALAKNSISPQENFVDDVQQNCAEKDQSKDSQLASPVQISDATSKKASSYQAGTQRKFVEQDRNASEHQQLPHCLTIPRMGTLLPLEEHSKDQIHEVEDNDRDQGDNPLPWTMGSPQQPATVVSPDVLSIERQDVASSCQSIGKFHRPSINEPSQLSLLSQRLEAVAARQVEEEQSESSIPANERMACMLSSEQSASSTPLLSANHSVPLTPMRAYSSYLATPVTTPAPTPFSFLFSPMDASTIQTPAEASILHSPVESLALNSDVKFDFDSDPSRHSSFTEWVCAQGGNGQSLGHISTSPGSIRGSKTALENVDFIDAQDNSISDALNVESQRDTDYFDVVSTPKSHKLKLNCQEQTQFSEATTQEEHVSPNPFLAGTTEHSRGPTGCAFTSDPSTEDSLTIGDDFGAQTAHSVRQNDTSHVGMAERPEGQNFKLELLDAKDHVQHLDVAVASLRSNPFLSQTVMDTFTQNSGLDGSTIADECDGQQAHRGSQLDEVLETDGQPENKSCELDIINPDKQTQNMNSTQVVLVACKNPFVDQSTENNPASLRSPEPLSQEVMDAAVAAVEHNEESFGPGSLDEYRHAILDKGTTLPEDVNALFSNNHFRSSTASDTSQNTEPSTVLDPWCPQPVLKMPEDSLIKLEPPPRTLRRKRNLAFAENRGSLETDRRQIISNYSPKIKGLQSKEQDVHPPEGLQSEGGKNVTSTDEFGYQNWKQEGTTLQLPHDSDWSAQDSERVLQAKIVLGAMTDIYESVTTPLHKPIHRDDGISGAMQDSVGIPNASGASNDIPQQSQDVTDEYDMAAIQSKNTILVQPDDHNLKTSEKKLEMQPTNLGELEGSRSERPLGEQWDESSSESNCTVFSSPDDAVAPKRMDDRTPLLQTEVEEFCYVTVEDAELERTSSGSSVATDDSSSTDTSISEGEMPYHKLQQ